MKYIHDADEKTVAAIQAAGIYFEKDYGNDDKLVLCIRDEDIARAWALRSASCDDANTRYAASDMDRRLRQLGLK